MPKVIEVRPEGIIVTMEYHLGELQKMKTGLDLVQINANMKDKGQADAANYITDEFYPLIKKIVEDLTHVS
jgi:hypothetical protein